MQKSTAVFGVLHRGAVKLLVLMFAVPTVHAGNAKAWGKPEVYLFILAAVACALGQVIS